MYAFLALLTMVNSTVSRFELLSQNEIGHQLEKEPGLITNRMVLPASANQHGVLLTLWQTEAHFSICKSKGYLDNILRTFTDRGGSVEVCSFHVVNEHEFLQEGFCECNSQYGSHHGIYALAAPFLDTRQNDLHTWIAYCFAVKLIEEEGGDESIVIPAVILHDVGWKAVPDKWHLKAFGPGNNDLTINKVHEMAGEAIARTILYKVEYDRKLTEEIVRIIEAHDSRSKPFSINDAIVKDADKLWRFSAEALIVDPRRFSIDPVIHCKWLKRQIEGWFITDTAKRIAYEEQRKRADALGMA
jgi:hypothetical protein